jgi:hypothetical protein
MNSEREKTECNHKRTSTIQVKKKSRFDKPDPKCKYEHDHEDDAQKLALITYFHNMPTGNFDIQKKKMKKKYDLLVDHNNQKENKLE